MIVSNSDAFIHLVINFIVKRLEVMMMQERFSQLGGLQLNRDARASQPFFYHDSEDYLEQICSFNADGYYPKPREGI